MPLYDFECLSCGRIAEHYASMDETTKPCVACGMNAKRIISTNTFVMRDENFVTDNITGDPVRITSRRQLRDLEKRHGVTQKIGKGWW